MLEAYQKECAAMKEAAAYLHNKGWVEDGGNISVLTDDHRILISKKGADFASFDESQIVVMSLAGDVLCGGEASTERYFHTAIYQAYSGKAVRAVVHCHSPNAEDVAAVGGLAEIPAVNYQLLNTGRTTIPITREFDLPGKDIVDQVMTGLDGGFAAILANHGQVTLGEMLERAVKRAHAVEKSARVFQHAAWTAAGLIIARPEGRPYNLKVIGDEKGRKMIKGFNTYYRR